MQNCDFKNYDYLTVTLKNRGASELIRYYKMLGWQVINQLPDGTYEDITHCIMRRPHKIANKDKLQFLQVRVETEVNKMAQFAYDRRKLSRAFSIVSAILALLSVAMGVAFIIIFNGIAWGLGGVALIALGVCVAIVAFFAYGYITKWEIDRVKNNMGVSMAKLSEILAKIRALRGELNEG